MTFSRRTLSAAAALVLATTGIAAADTVELTLTVPLTITMPKAGASSPAVTTGAAGARALKKFDVACAVGGPTLAYSTASGSAQNALGQGSTATSGGTVAVQRADGTLAPNPSATVILTYDTSLAGNGAPSKGPSNYVCWLTWRDGVTGLPPFFVQGSLPQ